MKWRLMVSLSVFGVLMGGASVFGFTQGIEWLLWLIIALISAFLMARSLQTRFFASAFLTGLLMSLLNGLTQSVFFQTYLAHNVPVAEGFQQFQEGLNPRVFVLFSSVVIGSIYGALIGLLTLLGRKFIKFPESGSSQK